MIRYMTATTETEIEALLAKHLNVVEPLRHIFGEPAREVIDALEVLLAQEIEHAASILASDWLAAHAEQERAWDEGYQRGLRDAEQDVQHGADNPYARQEQS